MRIRLVEGIYGKTGKIFKTNKRKASSASDIVYIEGDKLRGGLGYRILISPDSSVSSFLRSDGVPSDIQINVFGNSWIPDSNYSHSPEHKDEKFYMLEINTHTQKHKIYTKFYPEYALADVKKDFDTVYDARNDSINEEKSSQLV